MSTDQQTGSETPMPPGLGEVVERLTQWQAATQDVVVALEAERREAEAQSNRLESPSAIFDTPMFEESAKMFVTVSHFEGCVSWMTTLSIAMFPSSQ